MKIPNLLDDNLDAVFFENYGNIPGIYSLIDYSLNCQRPLRSVVIMRHSFDVKQRLYVERIISGFIGTKHT